MSKKVYYYTSHLAHHGIKGQKWGVENGPPYPLGSGDHNASERKAGWRSSLKKSSDKNNKKASRGDEENSDKKKKFQLTDKQKKYIKIGVGVTAGILAAYGGYELYKHLNRSQNEINLGKKNIDFIRNSGKFDYLDSDSKTNSTQKLSALCESVLNNFKNDTYKDAADCFDPEQIKKLSDDNLRCLQAYTTPLYKEANAVLRGDGEGTQAGKAIANGVKDALEKVTLTKDTEVQRGVNQSTARRILGVNNFTELVKEASKYGNNSDKFEVEALIDFSNKDSGIMSTAVPYVNSLGKKTSVADYFSGKEGVIFELTGKSGSHGMYISPLSEMKAEREIIFAPGSEILLNGTAQVIDGIIHIFGEIAQ